MSNTLYERATHHNGAVLWSGVDGKPSGIEHLKSDMNIELVRGLTMRSVTFEPAKIGHYSTGELGGVHGSGWRLGSAAVSAWMDLSNWGHQKDGTYQIRTKATSGSQHIEVLSSPAFEVHATKDLKFYFKGSINDVSESSTFIGMNQDAGGDRANWPTILQDAYAGTDGIGFLKTEAAATADMTFGVWEAGDATNSTSTVTFPAVIDDDVEFECGFHVHGDTAITVFMKVGLLETVTRLVRVSGSVLDELNTDINAMGAALSARCSTFAGDGINIKALAATQPL